MNHTFRRLSRSAKHCVFLSRQQPASYSQKRAEENISKNQQHANATSNSSFSHGHKSFEHDEQEERVAYLRFNKLNKEAFIRNWIRDVHPHQDSFSETGQEKCFDSNPTFNTLHYGKDSNLKEQSTTSNSISLNAVSNHACDATMAILPVLVHPHKLQKHSTISSSPSELSWTPSPLLFPSQPRRIIIQSERKRESTAISAADSYSVQCEDFFVVR